MKEPLKVYFQVYSPPPIKLGGEVLVLKLGQKGGHEKTAQKQGFLLERWGFQIVSSVFLKKSMFSLLLEYFFCLVNIHTCCNQ